MGAGDSGGGGGGGAGDASNDASGMTGPGPFGALPSGYCCTSKNDCRTRNCVSANGSMMCADDCAVDTDCTGTGLLPGFQCVGANSSMNGACLPSSTAATCTPASQFKLGTKGLGACCLATHNGAAGLECIGGHCSGWNSTSNPYECTNVCTNDVDCPGPYYCINVGTYSVCAPQSPDMYTCN
jgi:hypothetical protein